ncbi:MAG: glycosyltransferase [Caldilinea sp. CFX5]|nr:glycosyltransferase [Caldilinea sp. CFX5]
MRQQMLLVVAKQPAAGQTKTRLCPPLTGATAAALYECFLRDTLAIMRSVPAVTPGLVYLPAAAAGYFRELAPDFVLTLQEGADLGERLDNLLTAALAQGAKAAVVMDSDSPTLPVVYVSAAFTHLHEGADVVLGPCDDGGYYLIGLKRPQPRLLREVQMSTPTVLRDTLAIAEELGLRVALLPTWYDVDTAAELQRLRQELATMPAASPASPASHTRAFLETQLIG